MRAAGRSAHRLGLGCAEALAGSPGALLATEARHSVLVVGPTQSGKTSGLAVPALLEWSGPVIATSVKDDLAAAIPRLAVAAGAVLGVRPDPAHRDLRPLAGWTPLAGCAGLVGRAAGGRLAGRRRRRLGAGMADAAFWYAAAAKQLGPAPAGRRAGRA